MSRREGENLQESDPITASLNLNSAQLDSLESGSGYQGAEEYVYGDGDAGGAVFFGLLIYLMASHR
jgi:hypothetical protein